MTTLYDRVVDWFCQKGDGTTDEVEAALGVGTLHQRVAEAKQRHMLMETNSRRLTRAGRPAAVLRPTAEAYAYTGRSAPEEVPEQNHKMVQLAAVREWLQHEPLADDLAVAGQFGLGTKFLGRRAKKGAAMDPAAIAVIDAGVIPQVAAYVLIDQSETFSPARQRVLAAKMANGLLPAEGAYREIAERINRLVVGHVAYISARAVQQFFEDAELGYHAAVALGEEYLERERERKAEDRAMRSRRVVLPAAIPSKVFEQLDNIASVLEQMDERGILHPLEQTHGGVERFCSEMRRIADIALELAREHEPVKATGKLHHFTVIDGDVG